jgi:hypothetical protein
MVLEWCYSSVRVVLEWCYYTFFFMSAIFSLYSLVVSRLPSCLALVSCVQK